MRQKKFLVIVLLVVLMLFTGISYMFFRKETIDEPIKVGVIHSMSGTMSLQEPAVVKALMLAIDQINADGGILKRKIEPILFDGQSDWPMFARGAEKLIVKDKVAVLFGGWTSASRKAMLPIVERYQHLLFYPIQYEGLEESPHIFYLGSAPNQQLLPGLWWAMHNLGNKFFLVGSDYIYPRIAHDILKRQIQSLEGTVVGEAFLPLGSTRIDSIIDEIITKKPTVILNNIVGDSMIAFFKKLKERNITPETIPNMVFTFAEPDIKKIGTEYVVGNFATWNYFQTLESEKNKEFVTAFKEKYGQDMVVSNPMEAAYNAVYFWKEAVEQAGSTEINKVIAQLHGLVQNTPEGIIYIDKTNHHTWKYIRIGKVQEDGLFSIVWDSIRPVKPIPWLPYLSKLDWQTFVDKFYRQWGNKWEKVI